MSYIRFSLWIVSVIGLAAEIARRLRAMMENLVQTLPEYRQPALHEELELLDRELVRQRLFPEDLKPSHRRLPATTGLGEE